MQASFQNISEKSSIVHAIDETQAILKLKRQSPQNLDIKNSRVDRIRRTFWQRFSNSAPRWKVTYTVDAKQAESDTSD